MKKGRFLRDKSALPIDFPNNDGKMEDLNSALHVVLEDTKNGEVTFRSLLMSFPG